MSNELPPPALYTHELLEHNGVPNGVHLGCTDKAICEQAHVEGETAKEIREWFTAEQVRAAVLQEREANAKLCESQARQSGDAMTFYTATGQCAAAIRARSTP